MRWIFFFSLPNHSSRTVALESTQRLTEMSSRTLPGGKGRPARKAVDSVGASTAYYRDNFTTVSRTLGPIQLLIQWISEVLSAIINRPEREADHLPPSTAEVKKVWSYTSRKTCCAVVKLTLAAISF
jgi:hypothetical protein